jgi:hypothetical protein
MSAPMKAASEAIRRACWSEDDERNELEIQSRIADAVGNAMEKCAQLAERYPAKVLQFWDRPGGPPGNGYRPATGRDIAAAIRAQIYPRTETATVAKQ